MREGTNVAKSLAVEFVVEMPDYQATGHVCVGSPPLENLPVPLP